MKVIYAIVIIYIFNLKNLVHNLKGFGYLFYKTRCPQIYIQPTPFEDNDSSKRTLKPLDTFSKQYYIHVYIYRSLI